MPNRISRTVVERKGGYRPMLMIAAVAAAVQRPIRATLVLGVHFMTDYRLTFCPPFRFPGECVVLLLKFKRISDHVPQPI